jgi:hypothetical protein
MGFDFYADSVMLGGNIITVDPKNSKVEAVAIKDGKVLCVGPNELVKEAISKETKIKDLKGMTLVLGFTAFPIKEEKEVRRKYIYSFMGSLTIPYTSGGY